MIFCAGRDSGQPQPLVDPKPSHPVSSLLASSPGNYQDELCDPSSQVLRRLNSDFAKADGLLA